MEKKVVPERIQRAAKASIEKQEKKDKQAVLQSISNKLTFISILLVILVIGVFITYLELRAGIADLYDVIPDRIDLAVSAIERVGRTVESGMEMIYSLMSMMRLF